MILTEEDHHISFSHVLRLMPLLPLLDYSCENIEDIFNILKFSDLPESSFYDLIFSLNLKSNHRTIASLQFFSSLLRFLGSTVNALGPSSDCVSHVTMIDSLSSGIPTNFACSRNSLLSDHAWSLNELFDAPPTFSNLSLFSYRMVEVIYFLLTYNLWSNILPSAQSPMFGPG